MIDLSGLPDKSDGLDLSGLPDSNANALKSAYRNAPDASEAYAKSRSMAEMTGLPAEVVQRNPQSAEQMAAEPDWVSLEVDAPRLTQALSRDVELFKLAKDDVNQLGDLERIIRGIPRKESSSGLSAMNVLRGAGERTTDLIGNVAGFVATAGANVEKSAQLGGFVWENGAILPAYKSGAEFATWIAENPGGSILRNVQESLTAISLGYKPGTTWEDVKQSEGALNVAAKLASFGLETGLVSLPDMVAAVANAPAYFTSRTEEIAQDRAKNDGRESPTENDVAVAAGTAFIVAAMEKFGAERVFSAFIRGGSAPSKILKAAVGEGGTEFIQEQIEYAGESVGTEVGFDVGQSFERGLQGIVGGVTTGGAIAAVGATASAGRDAAVSGDAKELIARISRVEVAANKAQQSKEALDKAVDLASQTKLKTHSPEALASVMEEMLGDEAESIHLSAEAAQTFFQANPEALEIVQQKLPEVAASYVEAATTGGDVVIPTKDYITYFSEYHQALASKVRVGGGMSLEEAEQWKQQAGDEFKMEADAILQARAEDDAFQASADEVQQSIREQIEATGRFTPDVADKYAALHRAFAVTMADRLGITPSEVYTRYGLRIRVPASAAESAPLLPEEAAAGGTFDQAGSRGTLDPMPQREGSGDNLTDVEAVNDQLRQATEFYQPRHSQPDYAREARGFISFPENVQSAPSVITLLENADLSTFLHETGHFFFEVMADMASDPNAPDQIKKDMQTLLDWYGVENLEAWRKVPMQKRREGHEKFAGGFESYLFEGKAPSLELQSLFSRFRAWLMKVYESLRGLDVQLTPEVRQVMDRMLATDEQIRLSEAALSYRPLFESAEEAGMTGAEWDEYLAGDPKARQEAVEELETRSLKDMRWLSNAKSKALKELQAEAKDKRKAVAAEVTQEVQSHPVYQAIRFLKKGEVTTPDGEEIKAEEGYKLNNEALQEMYPPGALVTVDLKKLSGMVSEDGLPPDEIAGIFGFSSGDHLVQAIIEAKPIGEVIESLTDQRMLERYGDLVDPKAMEAAAESAVHNEARAKFVATELRALARRTGSRAVLVKAAKDYAAQKTAAKKVKDAIKPGQYSLAEARAAKAAETALRKGNPEQAATHKRAQLLNLYMFRAATDAKSEVEKTISYLRKFDREGTRKNLDQEYLDQIDRLLEAFDFRKVTGKALAKRASLKEWIEAQQAMGLDPVIDDALLGDLQKRHFSEVTLEELRGLKDTIKNIEHLGRLKKKLLTIQAKKELEELATQAEAAIRSSKVAKEMDIETRLPKDRAAQAVSSFFASHRKLASYMRQMDGFKDGGVMWELFTRPLNEASNKEAVMREEATKRLSELFARYTAKDMRAMYRKVYIPSIGRSLSKQARLVIALNWGNEDNRQRIMDGYNWTEVQVQAILNTLEEKDWQFVQDTWDYLNEYWPAISEKEKRVTGIAPEKVGPSPVQTKFGTFRGGYYPIKYDDRQSPRAFADAAKEAAKQALQGAFTRATTRRGHTKSRVEGVKRPVRLDFGVAFEHVEQVIHDLAFHEYLIDTNRLLGHEKIQSAIVETYGHEVYKQIKGTIDDVAAGDVPAQTAFQGAINWIRAGSSIAAMGWNIGTAMLQPLGLSQSMVRIGPKWVAKGLSRWARDAASMENTAAWINERSDFMRLRAKTMQREINEIRNKVEDQSARKKILGPAEDSYFWLISKAQMVADVPTWLGQYEKAMANGETEDKAIALADQAVLDSQGGGQVKDLAQIQRGGPLMKLWTNFYSYFNVTYNLTAESIRRTKFKDPASVGRLAVDMFLLYTAPAVLGWLLRGALIKGECDGGSDLECVAEKLTREQASYLMGTMVGLREMSGAVQGFYGYEGPGGARGFAAAAKLIKQVEQGEVDEALIKSLNATAGVFFHYPAGQVQRTAEGIAALSEGETSNPLAILTGAPKQ